MEKTSKELLKEFVNSRHFTGTSDIMNSMKEPFSDVLQTVNKTVLEEKLGCEKSISKNYRNKFRCRSEINASGAIPNH